MFHRCFGLLLAGFVFLISLPFLGALHVAAQLRAAANAPPPRDGNEADGAGFGRSGREFDFEHAVAAYEEVIDAAIARRR